MSKKIKEKDIRMIEEVSEEIVSDYIRGTLFELRDAVMKLMMRNVDNFHADKISEKKYGMFEIQSYSLLDIVDSYLQGLDADDVGREMPSKYKIELSRHRDN